MAPQVKGQGEQEQITFTYLNILCFKCVFFTFFFDPYFNIVLLTLSHF